MAAEDDRTGQEQGQEAQNDHPHDCGTVDGIRTSSVLWLNSPMPGKTVATVGSVFREGIQTSIEPRTTDIGKACAKFFSLCESWHPIF